MRSSLSLRLGGAAARRQPCAWRAARFVAAAAAAWCLLGATGAQAQGARLARVQAAAMPAEASIWPAQLQAALVQTGLPREALAFMAVPLEPGERSTAWAWQPDRSMPPASTMKVVTAAVALDRLGPNHRGATELWTQAPLAGEQGDVLMGDLVLRGGADPDLDLTQLWGLLSELRWQGVREIAGDMVLDRTLYQPARMDLGLPPFDESPEFPYNVVPDALQLGGNLLRLELKSDDRSLQARSLPALPLLQIDTSELRLSNRGCGRWDDDWKSPPTLTTLADGTLKVTLRGGFPRRCTQQAWLNLMDRNALAERLLRWTWTQLGGRWNGSVREAAQPLVGPWDAPAAPTAALRPIAPWPPVPLPAAAAVNAPRGRMVAPPSTGAPGAAAGASGVAGTVLSWRRLARHESRPWGELLRPMNKRSDNVLARLLYLELGRTDGRADRPRSAPAAAEMDVAPPGGEADGTLLTSSPAPAAAGLPSGLPSGLPGVGGGPAAAVGERPPERTADRADRVIRRWFADQGLATEGLVTDNGSGLSRSERITARQMVGALRAAYLGRWAPELMMSLPVAGIDGTLRNRLRDSPAGGWARLKTGLLRDAVAVAGYARDGQGRPWAVAAMIQHDRAPAGRAVLDALVDALSRQGLPADGGAAPQ